MDIKSFGDLFESDYTLSQKYVCVVYDDETQENLLDWCESNGIDTTQNFDGEPTGFEFHTTLFYTTSFHHIPETEHTLRRTGDVRAEGFEFLGENEDIPVLLVGGPDIYKLRDFFISKYRMEDFHPSFRPHITISYSDYDLDLDDLDLPDFPLTFDKLIIKDLELPRDSDVDSPEF